MEADSSPGTQKGLKHGWPELCALAEGQCSSPTWPQLAQESGASVKPGLGPTSLVLPPR